MSIKAINEAFEKMYSNNNLNESTKSLIEDVSPELRDLATALFKTLTRLENSGETNIKKYEVAFQDTIEEQFPEKSWWEVTDCDIFSDLFETRDPQKTVINIISKAKSDLTECDRSTQRVLEALRRIANKLTEAPMSDEDRKDSDLIRSAYDKIQKRSNARLTPEEQAVLNKYNIKRGYNKNLEYDSGRNYTRDDTKIVNNQDDLYSHGKEIGRRVYPKKPDGSTDWDKTYTLKTKDQDKINYADRARKRPEREKNRTYDYTTNVATFGTKLNHAWDERGIIDYNLKPGTDYRGRNYGVDQNTAINRMSQSRLAKMRGALGDRENAQADLDNAKAKFDVRKAEYDAAYMKKMQDAERDYDWHMNYANNEYKRDSDPSRRDKAQAEIDALLKRNKTEAVDLSDKKGSMTKILSDNDSWKNETTVQGIYKKVKEVLDKNNFDTAASKRLLTNISKQKSSVKALETVYNSILAGANLSTKRGTSKDKKESLKEDWSSAHFVSDIYNALADVLFKWHEAGYDFDESQINQAYEWFITHFWDDTDFEED